MPGVRCDRSKELWIVRKNNILLGEGETLWLYRALSQALVGLVIMLLRLLR
jgi:hypothetical protein